MRCFSLLAASCRVSHCIHHPPLGAEDFFSLGKLNQRHLIYRRKFVFEGFTTAIIIYEPFPAVHIVVIMSASTLKREAQHLHSRLIIKSINSAELRVVLILSKRKKTFTAPVWLDKT